MRTIICITAALALGTTSAQAHKAAKAKPFELNNTSWAFTDPDHKVKVRESIDADGNYIENQVSGKHVDHGTAVMKGKKACFTSAMTKEGEVCWTTPVHAMKPGRSFVTRSDKGQRLRVTRIAYVKLEMPK